MARTSVIVVTWNGERYLEPCLASLVAQLRAEDELLVVDNASSDGSPELVRQRFPQATLIQTGRNLGYAGGCNAGLSAATGRILVCANQDIVARMGWLEGLVEALGWDGVGVAGCKLLGADGRLQHVGGSVSYPLALPELPGRDAIDTGQWDAPRDVDYVMGAALAVRSELLDSIGAFDEGFFPAYYEETDLCCRARRAGWRVVYAPRSAAVHQETTSTARDGLDYHRWMGRGRLRYVLKHLTPTQFLDDFVPAERKWLGRIEPGAMRDGLRAAYLDALLCLHAVPCGGVLAAESDQAAVADTLMELRAVLAAPPAAGTAAAPGNAGDELWQIRERPFRSRVPVVGPLLAACRAAWNSVSTKWYVRPLLEQQNEANRQIAARLTELQQELAICQELLTQLDGEAADARVSAARSAHRLATRVERLEATLADQTGEVAAPKEREGQQ